MRFVYDNLAEDATLTASTEDSNYPVENVQDSVLTKHWRATGDSDENVVIDLGSAQNIKCVAILGHNLTDGATISFQGNATDSWGSPSVSVSPTYATGAIVYFWSTNQNYRYWRIRLQDSSNPDTYVKLGMIVVASFEELNNPRLAYSREYQDNTQRYQAISGEIYANLGVKIKRYGFDIPWLPLAQRQTLETIYADVLTGKPFLFVLDEDNMDKEEPIWCVFDGPPSFTHFWGRNYKAQMNLLEAK